MVKFFMNIDLRFDTFDVLMSHFSLTKDFNGNSFVGFHMNGFIDLGI